MTAIQPAFRLLMNALPATVALRRAAGADHCPPQHQRTWFDAARENADWLDRQDQATPTCAPSTLEELRKSPAAREVSRRLSRSTRRPRRDPAALSGFRLRQCPRPSASC